VKVDIPKNYALYQNYPNPFNPTTTIDYDLPKSSHVTIMVYDMLGQKVAKLVDENEEAGNYRAVFDASKLSSGVYFYRLVASGVEPLTAGSCSIVKKLVVLR
jgi:Secretion system C-terminal sorting domain